jgi:hypothetical protein
MAWVFAKVNSRLSNPTLALVRPLYVNTVCLVEPAMFKLIAALSEVAYPQVALTLLWLVGL